MLVRTLNDFELPQYNFQSRTRDPKWKGQGVAPEVVPLTDGNPPTKTFNIHVVKLDAQARLFCDELVSKRVALYLKTPFVGLNRGHFPLRLVVTTGNNLLEAVKADASGFWYQVRTYTLKELAAGFPHYSKLDLATGNYDKTRIQTFWTINARGILNSTAKGAINGVARWPLISDAPVWVHTSRVVPTTVSAFATRVLINRLRNLVFLSGV